MLPVFINDDDSTGYGMPWELRDIHMKTKSGGLPGYASEFILIPKVKLGITVLSSTATLSGNTNTAWYIADALGKALEETLQSYQPQPPLPSNIEDYQGTYTSSKGLLFPMSVQLQLVNDTLNHTRLKGVAPTGDVYLNWITGQTFVLLPTQMLPCSALEPGLYGAHFVFESDEKGNIVGFTAPDFMYGHFFAKKM